MHVLCGLYPAPSVSTVEAGGYLHIDFDFVVSGRPRQVADRLRAKIRFRARQYKTSWLGEGRFGGHVNNDSFTVALDPKHVLVRRQAVAEGTFTAQGSDTRVAGRIALPRTVVWKDRIVVLLGLLMLGCMVVAAFVSGAEMGIGLVEMGLLGCGLTGIVLNMTWQRSNIRASMKPLMNGLQETLK